MNAFHPSTRQVVDDHYQFTSGPKLPFASGVNTSPWLKPLFALACVRHRRPVLWGTSIGVIERRESH